jgi:hypothetical protein
MKEVLLPVIDDPKDNLARLASGHAALERHARIG